MLKPSEMASVTCLELAEIATVAGLPKGTLNVVTGTGIDAGAPLRCNLLSWQHSICKIDLSGLFVEQYTSCYLLTKSNEC